MLGLIFLRYADHRFTEAEKEFAESEVKVSSRRKISKLDYQAKGILYLPKEARFSHIRDLPEGEDIAQAVIMANPCTLWFLDRGKPKD